MDANLDDPASFFKLLSFNYPQAFTYARMDPGKTDADKRRFLRSLVAPLLPPEPPAAAWWAFRIYVRKRGRRAFDVENVGKTVIDTFSGKMVDKDAWPDRRVALFPDDTVDHVRVLQVSGERGDSDFTRVEVFGRVP